MKNTHWRRLIVSLAILLTVISGSASSRAANFTAGNLAIVVATANSANNTTCSVLEINTTTAGQTAIQSIPVPGTGASGIRVSGSATSTLYASDSDDGTLFCFTGANSTDTAANVNTLLPRAAVTVNNAGTISLATTYTGTSGQQTRAACSVNNATWFIGDQAGLYSNGSTSASPTGNFRGVKSFGGIVYGATASATVTTIQVGIFSAPTGGTYTGLPGLANNANLQDFYLVSSGNNGGTYDILYVVSATSNTAGTIAKYSLVSGSWVANGTYTTTFGGFGLCALKSGGGAVLFVTTGQGALAANSVIKLTDTAGYNSAIAITTANNVTLFTATSPATIKGVAFAPKVAATTPTVTASAATGVSGTAATLNGTVVSDGGATIIERGFVYDAVSGVTTSNNKTIVAGTTGAFSLNLSSLTPGQTYYFKAYASNSVGITLSSELTFNTPGGVAPTLTAAAGATVDNPFAVTFADDATWRGQISGITVDGAALSASAYAVSAGQITFTPSLSALLQTNGTKNISVQATGYSDGTVAQTIGFGAPAKLAIVTSPAAPAINGGALGTQPAIAVKDQYGNTVTTSTASISAAAGQLSWTLGGTLSVNASSGLATFSDLTAGAATAVSAATIDFTSGVLTGVSSTGFNIPAPAPPALTAAVGATVDAAFAITFSDNPSWRVAITGITVNGNTLSPLSYAVSAGQITFTPSASTLLQTNGTKTIVIAATGFADDTVSQVIGFGAATKLGLLTQPTAPASNGGALATQPVVAVQDQYGNTLTASSATITATATQGTWTLGGTASLAATAGVANFSGLNATAAGAVSGVTIDFTSAPLAPITSGSFNIPAPTPALAEVFVPQFIQGGLSTNGKRVPFAYRVTLYNLSPNTTYNYINGAVIASDSSTSAGAGNAIYVTSSGAFVRSGGPTLLTAGNYGTLTTDANGSYTGWFITEPTGNATRFATAGTQVYLRIVLNDGAGGTVNTTFLTTTNFATVTAFNTSGANSGTAIRGTSLATGKNFVMLYDNTAGTGRPIAGTLIEDDGYTVATGSSGYASFYQSPVDGVAGSWGTLIPNNLANGIRRIENRAKTDGSLVFANTDGDGAWPSGANTVNPAGGDATPIVISTSDASLVNISTPSLTLGSSANPAGFQDAVTFTATLPADALGNVIFSAANVPFSTNLLSSGVAFVSNNTLPRGTNLITVVYPGGGNYSAATNLLQQIITNHPPVAVADSFTRPAGIQTLRITISDLLTNDTDMDGDLLSFISAGTSTNGIPLYTNATYILYTNVANVADQFTYTLKDSYGDTTTGTVNILLGPAGVGQIQTINLTSSTALLQFVGVPNYSYSVERSTNLLDWEAIFTTNAPATPWQFADNLGPNPPPQAYYRLRFNP